MEAELIDYETHIGKSLQDPKFLEAYLNEALNEKDPRVFLIALKNIAKAKGGGISGFAKQTGFSRQTLYKTLSGKGNPTFNSLIVFLNAAGFHLKVEANKPEKKPKRTSRRQLTPA